MVCAKASIPVRVFSRNNGGVVRYDPLQRFFLVPFFIWIVEIMYDVHNTEREEEGMGFVWMASPELAPRVLHLSDEVSFDRIDARCWSPVNHRRLPFGVRPHFKSLLHLNVAPEYCQYNGINIYKH